MRLSGGTPQGPLVPTPLENLKKQQSFNSWKKILRSLYAHRKDVSFQHALFKLAEAWKIALKTTNILVLSLWIYRKPCTVYLNISCLLKKDISCLYKITPNRKQKVKVKGNAAPGKGLGKEYRKGWFLALCSLTFL